MPMRSLMPHRTRIGANRDLMWCKYWMWELRDAYEDLAPLYAQAWRYESRDGHLASNLERYHLAAQRAIERADAIYRVTERTSKPKRSPRSPASCRRETPRRAERRREAPCHPEQAARRRPRSRRTRSRRTRSRRTRSRRTSRLSALFILLVFAVFAVTDVSPVGSGAGRGAGHGHPDVARRGGSRSEARHDRHERRSAARAGLRGGRVRSDCSDG